MDPEHSVGLRPSGSAGLPDRAAGAVAICGVLIMLACSDGAEPTPGCWSHRWAAVELGGYCG
jgi:hypothetical protein